MRIKHECIYRAQGTIGGQIWAVYQDLRADKLGEVSVRANGKEMLRATRASWDAYIADSRGGRLLDDGDVYRYMLHILRDQRSALISVHESYADYPAVDYRLMSRYTS